MIAAPFLTLLMVGLGWRWMFVVMGLAGFVSAAAWLATYRDPADAGLAAEDHALGRRRDGAGRAADDLRALAAATHLPHQLGHVPGGRGVILHGQRVCDLDARLHGNATPSQPDEHGLLIGAGISLLGAALYWFILHGPITPGQLGDTRPVLAAA